MKRTKSQYKRLMDLDRLIRDGKYPNCLTFSAQAEVTQKTVQRDIDYLRDQWDAPLAYDRIKKGFYYTKPTWALPSVVMSEGDLFAIMLASRVLEIYRGTPVSNQLATVFGRLAAMLPDKLSIDPATVQARFSFRGTTAKPVDAGVWQMVVRAVLRQETLSIRYRPFDAEKTEPGKMSRINPYHIANLQGEWYVFGVHAGHDDVRQFSMARIEKAVSTGDRFTLPSDFDPEKLLASVFGRFAGGDEVHNVRLLFSKDVARWVTEREYHPQQQIKIRRTGEVELSFPAKGLFEVQRWVLSWGHDVTVLGPKELLEGIQQEILLMAKGVKNTSKS